MAIPKYPQSDPVRLARPPAAYVQRLQTDHLRKRGAQPVARLPSQARVEA